MNWLNWSLIAVLAAFVVVVWLDRRVLKKELDRWSKEWGEDEE